MVKTISNSYFMKGEFPASLDAVIKKYGGKCFDEFHLRSILRPVLVRTYEIPKKGQVTTEVASDGTAKFTTPDGVLVYSNRISFAGFNEENKAFKALYSAIEQLIEENIKENINFGR